MGKIIAKGRYQGLITEVVCTIEEGDLVIDFNGEEDRKAYEDLMSMIENQKPMGGTYYPPKNSLLAAYNVLSNMFFDDGEPESLSVEGDIGQIPTYDIDGIVY